MEKLRAAWHASVKGFTFVTMGGTRILIVKCIRALPQRYVCVIHGAGDVLPVFLCSRAALRLKLVYSRTHVMLCRVDSLPRKLRR